MRHFRSLAMGDGPEADAKEAKLLELIGARSEALCEKLVASLLDRFGRCAREAPLPPSPPPPPAWQLLLRPLLLLPLRLRRIHCRRQHLVVLCAASAPGGHGCLPWVDEEGA